MRLMLVEDYAPLRASLVEGLRDAGFAVDATGDGAEAAWLGDCDAYDVAILDLMLPGLDGLSVLRRWRSAGRRYPVLILTARSRVSERVAGLNAGADDYLVKPFAFEELLARVHALVRRKYDARDSIVHVGPLSVDLQARQAHCAEAPLDLTARELEILTLLALRRGHTVTRTEMHEHLYGFDAEPESNVVDVHIAQLRRKLAAACDRPLIHTRRGIGYRLDEQP